MRIAMISEIFPPIHGGVPVFVEQLATNLGAAGHDVLVVTNTMSYRDTPRRGMMMPHGYQLSEVRSLSMPFNKEFRSSFLPRRRVLSMLADFQPDVIHAHTPVGLIHVGALRYARLHNVPIIVTNHIMHENSQALLKTLGPLAEPVTHGVMQWTLGFINHCDMLVGQTTTALDIVGRDAVTIPSCVISNGVDVSYYVPSSSGEPKNRYFFSVGRLSAEKRLDVLLEALAIARKTCPDMRLIIGGKGPQRAELEALVSKLGLDGVVKFVGYISDEKKRDYMQHAAAYVNASPAELQNIVALESLACNTAVILADKGATVELVTHGRNGYLFQFPNAEDLARTMVELWTHPIGGDTQFKAARQFTVDHHAHTDSVRNYVTLYDQLATQRREPESSRQSRT